MRQRSLALAEGCLINDAAQALCMRVGISHARVYVYVYVYIYIYI